MLIYEPMIPLDVDGQTACMARVVSFGDLLSQSPIKDGRVDLSSMPTLDVNAPAVALPGVDCCAIRHRARFFVDGDLHMVRHATEELETFPKLGIAPPGALLPPGGITENFAFACWRKAASEQTDYSTQPMLDLDLQQYLVMYEAGDIVGSVGPTHYCYLAGRIFCVHSYSPGGQLRLIVIDMTDRCGEHKVTDVRTPCVVPRS